MQCNYLQVPISSSGSEVDPSSRANVMNRQQTGESSDESVQVVSEPGFRAPASCFPYFSIMCTPRLSFFWRVYQRMFVRAPEAFNLEELLRSRPSQPIPAAPVHQPKAKTVAKATSSSGSGQTLIVYAGLCPSKVGQLWVMCCRHAFLQQRRSPLME